MPSISSRDYFTRGRNDHVNADLGGLHHEYIRIKFLVRTALVKQESVRRIPYSEPVSLLDFNTALTPEFANDPKSHPRI